MVEVKRRIETDVDLHKFLRSRQFAELWAFILHLNSAVLNKRVSTAPESSAAAPVKAVLDALDTCREWAEQIPATKKPGRFGNPAFRLWHAKVCDNAPRLVESIIRSSDDHSTVSERDMSDYVYELTEYWRRSFGDATRIDYGSGHEAMFAVFLYCLRSIDIFKDSDSSALVLLVFRRYLSVTRLVQLQYMLEPAGSHGVWGLDDYSFLPFLWGSSQLISSTRVQPRVISDDSALSEHKEEYLYLDAIAFIKKMKSGPFFEHSPMLHDISAVPGGWAKINSGMIKMYRGEVWEKRVVVQHFVFGKIFRFDDQEDGSSNRK